MCDNNTIYIKVGFINHMLYLGFSNVMLHSIHYIVRLKFHQQRFLQTLTPDKYRS